MKLKKLLKDFDIQFVKGSKETEITGITSNSKVVSPGNLFIAKKGKVFDGTQFISEAVSAGAVAILTDIYNPFLEDVVQIIDPAVLELEPKLAKRFYQFSPEDLFTIGITGTNGKTTSSYLVKHLLEGNKEYCGFIGTVETTIRNYKLSSDLTTPDVVTNHKLLKEMVTQECKSAVMEVSSHALAQGRVEGIDFDIALFTNLTEEHLDYHETMKEYIAQKVKLYGLLQGSCKEKKYALINLDSPFSHHLPHDEDIRHYTYGIDNKADLTAKEIVCTNEKTTFVLTYLGRDYRVVSPLLGRFNVYNLLGAFLVGICKGIDIASMIKRIKSFDQVPGRVEKVKNDRNLQIIVDFAHTPDALQNILETLREITKGRLICLFGCGGDRDPYKRPKMGRIAEELANLVIVTSDNPRYEDPKAIIDQIVEGFVDKRKHHTEVDRQKAIEYAISCLEPDDILLIAGKGHETRQLIAGSVHELDDRLLARDLCLRN